MQQVVQSLRDGKLRVEAVPPPTLRPGALLVRNHASLISAGTERAKVTLARKSLVGKAAARPDLTRQALQTLRQQGPVTLYHKVMGRLDRLSPLGYSCAGTVLEVGAGADGFAVGDRVACAGAEWAHHAEMVCVPRNLCVKLPPEVSFDSGAFTTVGAIALHGVRQSAVALGDSVAVIGLGLIGLLTVQLLKAAGAVVFGIDVDPLRVALAREFGAEIALTRDSDGLLAAAHSLTSGRGVDAAILTASAPSNDPICLAGELCRDRGRVVVLGQTRIDAPRELYYQKELSIALSRSYGPGRYDPAYEERGFDYPPGYVRWTEGRNMEEFVGRVARGQVTVERLITHRFRIDTAAEAYEAVVGGETLGVLLEYPYEPDRATSVRLPTSAAPHMAPPASSSPYAPRRRGASSGIGVGLIGAGNFATGVLLPILRAARTLRKVGVATASGVSARSAAERFGFAYCTSRYQDLLDDPEIDAVIVATRHDLHARITAEAIRAGRAVFVEKPLALSHVELDAVVEAWGERSGLVMVGFNRRHSPACAAVRRHFCDRRGPLSMSYRINAGPLPDTSWLLDPREGGGRILGEVCHFVDTLQFLAGAPAESVYAETLGHAGRAAGQDTVHVVLRYADGSVGSIQYATDGDSALPKERLELFADGASALIDDFRTTTLSRDGKTSHIRAMGTDKGHAAELALFRQLLETQGVGSGAGLVAPAQISDRASRSRSRNGKVRGPISDPRRPPPGSLFAGSVAVTLTTLAIVESARTGRRCEVRPPRGIADGAS